MSNTESDVFRLGKTGPVYYLVAGRWFSAPDFTGPWTFATPSLPRTSRRSRSSTTARACSRRCPAPIRPPRPCCSRRSRRRRASTRRRRKAPEVAYQGEAQFAPIEQTTVQRAVNTDKDVFKVGDLLLHVLPGRLVRRQDRHRSLGGRRVGAGADLPDPASSPSHHVTYVTVEDDDDDEWVTFAAAAGYTGMMVAWGCTVWGTGWYYPPYYGCGGYYPYYYPHFPTYGYSAWYNPWTGAYGRSAGVYGPYGGAGVGARYNPRTGTYARGAAAYGPYGARGVAQAYNPRTGTYAATRQGSNVYGSWGSTAVQRGDDWAKTNRYTNRQTGTTTRTIRTDEGAAVMRRGAGGGTVGVGQGGNVYAGNDGNVYRRQDGTWQKYDNGNWSNTPNQPADRPRPTRPIAPRAERPQATTGPRSTQDRSTIDQLNRDSAARAEGTQRTRRLRQLPQRRQQHARHRQLPGGGGGARRAAAAAAAVTQALTTVRPQRCHCALGDRAAARRSSRCARRRHRRGAQDTRRRRSPPNRRARRPRRSRYVPSTAERWAVTVHREFLNEPVRLLSRSSPASTAAAASRSAPATGSSTATGPTGTSRGSTRSRTTSSSSSAPTRGGTRSGRFDLHGRFGWRDATQVAYYGLGMTSPEERANFRMKQTYVGGDVQVRPGGFTVFGVGITYEDYTLEAGAGSDPSIEEIFTPATAPGSATARRYLHTPFSGGLDWRPSRRLRAARRPLPGHATTTTPTRRDLQLRSRSTARSCSTCRSCARPGWSRCTASCRPRSTTTTPCRTSCCRRSAAAARCGPTRAGATAIATACCCTGELRWIPNRSALDMAVFYDMGKVASHWDDLSLKA